MKIRQIKETCLYIVDLELAIEFYENVLGLQRRGGTPPRDVFFRVGDGMLLLFNPEETEAENLLPAHYAYGPQHIAFEVEEEDYEEWKERISDNHIEILHEHQWPNGRKSFYFHDPAGNILEIVMPGMWD